MSVPHTNQLSSVEAVAGQNNCIPIPAPLRGHIRRIVVKQIDGADAGVYDIYDRRDACPPEGTNTTTTTTTLPPDYVPALQDPECHKIQVQQSISSGLKRQDGIEISYQNRDGHDPNRTVNRSWLYMNLVPTGSGTMTYDISITIDVTDPG